MSQTRVQAVIPRICSIPDDYNRGETSIAKLLFDSGFPAFRGRIKVAAICQHLEAHPELIDAWVSYSNEAGRKDGWYFDDGRRLIGRFSDDGSPSREQQFSNRVEACAEFIKRELDYIYNLLSPPKPWWRFW